jgi:chemotaxis protein methyltransferase CheR
VAERNACRTLAELVVRLRSAAWSDLHRQVVEMMTTNETYFFRDGQPFEALVQLVLPQIIKARGEERKLNIWCAACSTGQEPYSILMVLRDRLPVLANWQIKLVATDLNAEVLGRALAGRYSSYEVNRGLTPAYLSRFFRVEGNEYVVAPELRKAVDFQVLNLLDAWPGMPGMDVVFLRNVLIYFDIDTKRAILNKVRKLLTPTGFLFLGGAETTLNIDDRFERVPFDRAGCYRLRADAVSIPSGRWPVATDKPIVPVVQPPA